MTTEHEFPVEDFERNGVHLISIDELHTAIEVHDRMYRDDLEYRAAYDATKRELDEICDVTQGCEICGSSWSARTLDGDG